MRSTTVTTVPRLATLFDRVAEWETPAPRLGSAVGIVTGPRRQGKTFLPHELARATGGFCFEAQEATAAESPRHLGDQLARHLGAFRPERWDTWAQALEYRGGVLGGLCGGAWDAVESAPSSTEA
ncbi:hypothetical protein [Kitasatospora sp. NPDC056531]|uniref:hypothetical protein n=1 Tax=Kitasatospora sp. NPDC056531 TaxID=3345856 RepID=UPI0036A41D37